MRTETAADPVARRTADYATLVTIKDKIESNLSRMPRRQAFLGRYILDHLQEVAFMPAADLAAQAGVSEPTVIRFARALGYAGYQDLRREAQRFLRFYLGPGDKIRGFLTLTPDHRAILDKVFDIQETLLRETRSLLSHEAFWCAVEAICKARCVFLFGQGAGVILPEMLNFRLQRCGFHTYTLTSGGRDIFEKVHLITEKDVVVAFTFFQTDEDAVIVLDQARSAGAKTILVAESVEPDLANGVDVILFVKRGDVGTFRSYAIPMIVVEALALGVVAADEERCLAALDRLHEIRASHARVR